MDGRYRDTRGTRHEVVALDETVALAVYHGGGRVDYGLTPAQARELAQSLLEAANASTGGGEG